MSAGWSNRMEPSLAIAALTPNTLTRTPNSPYLPACPGMPVCDLMECSLAIEAPTPNPKPLNPKP